LTRRTTRLEHLDGLLYFVTELDDGLRLQILAHHAYRNCQTNLALRREVNGRRTTLLVRRWRAWHSRRSRLGRSRRDRGQARNRLAPPAADAVRGALSRTANEWIRSPRRYDIS